jgi:hypothetical protein
MGDTPINRRREMGRINTVVPETLTRIEPKTTGNFTGLVEMQIQTGIKRLREISRNSNHCPNENFPCERREKYPEAEQEKSLDSGGLEEIQNSGSVSEDGEEKPSGDV